MVTADSLIGHKEARWRAFGWAAARTDDVMNLLPARLGGVVICLAGGGGWRTLWRDHGRHASPSAGWTEAAMAGALDLAEGNEYAAKRCDAEEFANAWNLGYYTGFGSVNNLRDLIAHNPNFAHLRAAA
jgi:cobalamin biosynthesis protein CobD/CbiB